MALPALFTALTAIGGGVEILGKIASYKQEKEINKAQMAEIFIKEKLNAALGASEAYMRREILRKTLSRNIAATAAGGAMMDGSPIQAQLNAIWDAAYDINVINFNTAIKDWSLRQGIENLKFGNKIAKKNLKLGILESLTGTANKLTQNYYMAKLYGQSADVEKLLNRGAIG